MANRPDSSGRGRLLALRVDVIMQLRSSLLPRGPLAAGALGLALMVGFVFRRVWGAGFFQDDWIFLARAAGILPAPDIPVRPLSFDLYWRVVGAALGGAPTGYAFTRFLLHVGAGLVVVHLARLLHATVATALSAGALYLLSPMAFEALYWASGVTDLLANMGLLIAIVGILRGGRPGIALLIAGGLVSLASKETGWWLPLGGFMAWRWHRLRGYLWATGLLVAAAVVALASTSRALSHDYVWSLGSIPWNLARAGSWIVPRADDLIRVWEADSLALAIGAIVWVAWIAWAVVSWRRSDRLPAMALACSLFALAPVVGLAGHMVPRYVLPVQAGVAITTACALRGRGTMRYIGIPLVVVFAFLASSCVDQFLDKTYPQGRPAHRMVAKERMVRSIWKYLDSNGVEPWTGVAFLRRPADDVAIREYMLDVIGHTWGPKVVLGSHARVIVADRAAEIPLDTPVFQFGHWSLEYLGVLRRQP